MSSGYGRGSQRRSVGALRRGASTQARGASATRGAPRKRVSFDLARNTSHPVAAPATGGARGSAFAAFAQKLQEKQHAAQDASQSRPDDGGVRGAASAWDWRDAPTPATEATAAGKSGESAARGGERERGERRRGDAKRRGHAHGLDEVERELLGVARADAGDEDLDFDSLYSDLQHSHAPVFWQDATPLRRPAAVDAVDAAGTQPWLLEQLARRAGSAESAVQRVWSRMQRHTSAASPATSPTHPKPPPASWLSLGVGVAAVFACNAVWELAFPDMRTVFTDQLEDIHREADYFF